jgi:hypothetical protein
MDGEVTIKLGGVALDVRYSIDEPYEAQDIVLDRVTVPGSTVDIAEALHAAAVAGIWSGAALTAELRYIRHMQDLVMTAAEAQAARNAADALADRAAELADMGQAHTMRGALMLTGAL